jgi:hypothetical protein
MFLAHRRALPDNSLSSTTFANPWKLEPSANSRTGDRGEHPDVIQVAFWRGEIASVRSGADLRNVLVNSL